jgi:hypothetical protein
VITCEDAELALARWYDFADWPRLNEYHRGYDDTGLAGGAFRSRSRCVIDGNIAKLRKLLREDPALV